MNPKRIRYRRIEQSLANEIRRLLKEQHLTQKQFAQSMGFTEKMVVTYLSGRRGLLSGTALTMLAKLRVQVRLEPISPTCGDCAFFQAQRCQHLKTGGRLVPTFASTAACTDWRLKEMTT